MPQTDTKTFLRQAREARKLSLSDVAEYAGISARRLKLFETSEAQPSFVQLQKLAEIYGAEPFNFLSESPLELEEGLPDFRKAHLSEAKVSPKGLSRIWQVQRQSSFIQAVTEALGKSAPKRKDFSRITNRIHPGAEALRSNFDEWKQRVESKLKIGAVKEDQFFNYVRLFLDVSGCNTVYNSAPEQDYLGFYSEKSGGPLVFVNREIEFSRRKIFTLCHEMAHLIFESEGISDPFQAKNEMERRCNSYAARFIATDKHVRQVVERNQFGKRDADRLISAVSFSTFLSKQAAALRLLELDLIDSKDVKSYFGRTFSKRINEEFEPSRGSVPMGRGAAVGKKLSELGLFNAYVAHLGKKERLIDDYDLEQSLGLSEKIRDSVLDLAARRFEAASD